MKFEISEVGHELNIDDKFHIFFGNRKFNDKNFDKAQLCELKQVHGVEIIKASSEKKEADGHWTDERGKALRIVTADCIPLLIIDKKTERIAALHAGWRGLFNGIVSKALRANFEDTSSLLFFIGPHISEKSFEVRHDALELIQKKVQEHSHAREDEVILPHPEAEKNYIDLKKYLYAEFHAHEVSDEQVYGVDIDTFTNENFPSYRREGPLSGRIFSYVLKV